MKHERDGVTFKENRTQYISHLSERVCVGDVSRVREQKYAYVARVKSVRCGVLFTHPSLTKASLLPVSETP